MKNRSPGIEPEEVYCNWTCELLVFLKNEATKPLQEYDPDFDHKEDAEGYGIDVGRRVLAKQILSRFFVDVNGPKNEAPF